MTQSEKIRILTKTFLLLRHMLLFPLGLQALGPYKPKAYKPGACFAHHEEKAGLTIKPRQKKAEMRPEETEHGVTMSFECPLNDLCIPLNF